MSIELKKRIITSFSLFLVLILMHLYSFVLIICLIILGIICWIEFYGLISKIFFNETLKNKILRFIIKFASLLYLSLLIFFILYVKSKKPELQILIIYSLFVSIFSDIGGFIFGKIIKGKKLTKLSPNKTISGSFGSFIFSVTGVFFFTNLADRYDYISLIIITILISITSQLGDLFISFLKRRANVKDTSNLLPGHGGFLDRVDGIIFAIPMGLLLFNLF